MSTLLVVIAALMMFASLPARACDVPLLALTIGDASQGLSAAVDAPTQPLAHSHAREASDALGQAALQAVSCACTRAALAFARASSSARIAMRTNDPDGFDQRMG